MPHITQELEEHAEVAAHRISYLQGAAKAMEICSKLTEQEIKVQKILVDHMLNKGNGHKHYASFKEAENDVKHGR